MSSKVMLPTLSDDGWETNSIKVADYLMCHFLESDRSQTYLYKDHVSSLAWIIQNTQGDMTRTIELTQATLIDYFTKYFNNVIVEVTEIPNTTDPSKGQISIYLKFVDTENKEFVLGRLIDVVDTKIKTVIDISNGV